mmetsp:Transcript_17239/g.59868  ORF Transcript_17239/g.59868 Transcript_17239/m.59868 type:complete len:312 (-) Transcript_17239:234-1169(-)
MYGPLSMAFLGASAVTLAAFGAGARGATGILRRPKSLRRRRSAGARRRAGVRGAAGIWRRPTSRNCRRTSRRAARRRPFCAGGRRPAERGLRRMRWRRAAARRIRSRRSRRAAKSRSGRRSAAAAARGRGKRCVNGCHPRTLDAQTAALDSQTAAGAARAATPEPPSPATAPRRAARAGREARGRHPETPRRPRASVTRRPRHPRRPRRRLPRRRRRRRFPAVRRRLWRNAAFAVHQTSASISFSQTFPVSDPSPLRRRRIAATARANSIAAPRAACAGRRALLASGETGFRSGKAVRSGPRSGWPRRACP